MQLLACGALFPKAFTQCFECYIQAYFVSELEAVHNGFCRRSHAYTPAVQHMRLNSFAKRAARCLENQEWRRIYLRNAFACFDEHPYLPWVLRSEVMKSQGRGQTNYSVRETRRCFDDGLIFTGIGIRKRIQASSGLLKKTAFYQLAEIRACNPMWFEFACPQDFDVTRQLSQLFFSLAVRMFHKMPCLRKRC